MSELVRARIDALLSKSKVMLFMKGTKLQPACGFSNTVVQILNTEGVEFDTFNVLADAELRDDLKLYSGWPTYPQLYVDGKLVGGCDIVSEMHETGALAGLLK